MDGRAALVTGGSSGIGLAIARMLGKDGYRLTVSARRPEKLESAVAGLRDEGIDVEAVPANMIDEQEVVRLVESHRERLGASRGGRRRRGPTVSDRSYGFAFRRSTAALRRSRRATCRS